MAEHSEHDLGAVAPEGDSFDFETAENPEDKLIVRGEPEVRVEREKLVKQWVHTVRRDKQHWYDYFKAMREDQEFSWGSQWSRNKDDDRYVANITLRHIQQRVASLYARNPKAVAARRPRLMSTTWDGTMGQVLTSMQQLTQANMGPTPPDAATLQEPISILKEAEAQTKYNDNMDGFAKTLEMLYEYNIGEQAHPFKSMMKLMVRRAVTTGVGYVKLGFQRVMEARPDIEARIADATQKMATLERLSADFADGEIEDPNGPEKEQLRILLTQLNSEQEAVVREGLVFDYPDSVTIIPDRNTRQLREFLGADHVSQEYVLSNDKVKEIYGVDIGTSRSGEAMREGTTEDTNVSPVHGDSSSLQQGDDPSADPYRNSLNDAQGADHSGDTMHVVWEIYSRKDGMVYVVADGYKDFLRDPAPPPVWTERFWPWFALVLNESDHPKHIFPPSDVRLIMSQQKEYNRLREGLREHRKANRPAIAVAGGRLSTEDVEKLVTHPANAVLEFDGLQPGQKIDDLLQTIRWPGLDPNLYEVNGVFEDILRTVGVQEANFGGNSGGTATESSIAEGSRQASIQSNVDDLDDMLTYLARAAGQILLGEVSPEIVKQTLGPGAVWPELTRDQMAKELFLEIEAGSTGRPNQATEISNFERLVPLLMQIPGISPEALAKEGIKRLNDKLDLADIYDKSALSIAAMNQAAGAVPGGAQQNAGPNAPGLQGPAGANNAPVPTAPEGGVSGVDPTQPGIPGPLPQ